MKRRILFSVAVLLILAGIFILVRVAANILTPKGYGALQITTNVKAEAFLNNKPIGETPLCLCEGDKTVESGEHDLRIVPTDGNLSPFTAKIRINPGVLTAVERTFLPGALSSSYTLTLEETNSSEAEVFIASIPEGALVSIDGEGKSVTPLFLESLSLGEHEIEIQKQGFSKKTIRVRTVPSFKLVLNVILGTDTELDDTEESIETATTPLSPTQTSPPENSVIINDTPVGFLRVRAEATTSADEIGQVSPGEIYPIIDETSGWFQIELEDGSLGWISKTYSERVPE